MARNKGEKNEQVQLVYFAKKNGVGHAETISRDGKDVVEENCVVILHEGERIVIPFGKSTRRTFPPRVAANFVAKSRMWGDGSSNAPALKIKQVSDDAGDGAKPAEKMNYNELGAEAKKLGLEVVLGGPQAIGKDELLKLVLEAQAKG